MDWADNGDDEDGWNLEENESSVRYIYLYTKVTSLNNRCRLFPLVWEGENKTLVAHCGFCALWTTPLLPELDFGQPTSSQMYNSGESVLHAFLVFVPCRQSHPVSSDIIHIQLTLRTHNA